MKKEKRFFEKESRRMKKGKIFFEKGKFFMKKEKPEMPVSALFKKALDGSKDAFRSMK